MKSTRPSKKTQILDAAARIVSSEGAGHLTIDRVAKEAGLSKGGVLYHFPNKRALLEGMLQLLLSETQTRADEYRQANADREVVIYLNALSQLEASQRAMSLSILASSAEDPSLLAPARDFINETFGRIANDSDDPDLHQILLLACEGLRFINMLDLWPDSEVTQTRLRQRIADMAAAPTDAALT